MPASSLGGKQGAQGCCGEAKTCVCGFHTGKCAIIQCSEKLKTMTTRHGTWRKHS